MQHKGKAGTRFLVAAIDNKPQNTRPTVREPPLPVPFSSDDLGRIFEARTLTRGRSLLLIGAVEVSLDGETVVGKVEDKGVRRTAKVTPVAMGRRVVFENRCTCRLVNCPHLAATAYAALDRFPMLRRAEQATFIENLQAAPAPENTTTELMRQKRRPRPV